MVKNQNDPNPFKYNLSAFLITFRSIRDFMQKELEGTKLDACYKQLINWMDDDARIMLLRAERNVTTHERIIWKHNNIVVYVGMIEADGKVRADYTWYFAPDPKNKEIQKIRNVNNIIKTDVITLCRSCLEELERRISACDQGLLRPIC